MVQQRRPQAVLVEVHDLSQSRPVHAVLQSQAFRTHLEAIVRGSISTAQRNSPRLPQRRGLSGLRYSMLTDTNYLLSCNFHLYVFCSYGYIACSVPSLTLVRAEIFLLTV